MTARRRLPNRRPSITASVEHAGVRYSVMIGYDLEGRPREIFCRATKTDSDADLIADDVSILISLALQYGIEPHQLAHIIGRLQDRPASIVGVLVDLLLRSGGGAPDV